MEPRVYLIVIFYTKKIQKDKLKIQFLNYILEQINDGIKNHLNVDNVGKLVAHTKEKNYNKLWYDYSGGKIFGSELTKILFQH